MNNAIIMNNAMADSAERFQTIEQKMSNQFKLVRFFREDKEQASNREDTIKNLFSNGWTIDSLNEIKDIEIGGDVRFSFRGVRVLLGQGTLLINGKSVEDPMLYQQYFDRFYNAVQFMTYENCPGTHPLISMARERIAHAMASNDANTTKANDGSLTMYEAVSMHIVEDLESERRQIARNLLEF